MQNVPVNRDQRNPHRNSDDDRAKNEEGVELAIVQPCNAPRTPHWLVTRLSEP